VGYSGREILPNRLQSLFNKIGNWCCNRNNSIYISIFLFLYGAFIPLPNDIVILSLGAAKYNYWKLIIPLGLGNIVFNTMIAFFGLYGLNLIF
jgi:membrane protein YqaA with SNARE-associated domain